MRGGIADGTPSGTYADVSLRDVDENTLAGFDWALAHLHVVDDHT